MERISYIDYVKAISIAFVVFIHVGFSSLNNIVLFAMPAFFAATGYTFSPGKRSIKEGIKLRFKSIMLPFWYTMLIYTLIEVVRAYLFKYGSISIAFPSLANTIYGSGIIPFNEGIFSNLKDIMSYKAQTATGVDVILPANCHLWFLPAMFTGYVFFIVFSKATLKNHMMKILTVVFLLLISSIEVIFPSLNQLPYGLGRGAIGASFMLFGFWIKEYKLLDNKPVRYHILTSAFALIIYISSILLGSNAGLLVRSVYGPYGIWSVFITFFGGATGIWLIFNICKLIESTSLEKTKKLLSFTGRNVMTVYLWHMAVKFVLDVIYICFIKGNNIQLLDEYKMGLIPTNSFAFILFEAIAIITICLSFCLLKERKNRSINK